MYAQSIEHLASRLKYSKVESLADLLKQLDLQYRKDKTIADVRKAITKAHLPKNGMLKSETEERMLALYLKGVLKAVKKELPV